MVYILKLQWENVSKDTLGSLHISKINVSNVMSAKELTNAADIKERYLQALAAEEVVRSTPSVVSKNMDVPS